MLAALLFASGAFGQQQQDWPNLPRYAAENTSLAAPAESENRVVFMGDSLQPVGIKSRPVLSGQALRGPRDRRADHAADADPLSRGR